MSTGCAARARWKAASRPLPATLQKLLDKTFIDDEGREVTVIGSDSLFPKTHVQILREGKPYSLLAERLLTFKEANGKEQKAPPKEKKQPTLTADEQHYAQLADKLAQPALL